MVNDGNRSQPQAIRSSRRDLRKQRLFDKGADAFASSFAHFGLPRGYVCPQCIRLFTLTLISDLTFEHVPPKHLGGREIVLTCRECNSWSGSELDGYIENYKNFREFKNLRIPAVKRATASIGSKRINASVESVNGSPRVRPFPAPRGNDLSKVFSFEHAFAAWRAQGKEQSFEIEWRLKNVHRGKPALLRHAYLMAFCAGGYRYISGPTFETIRQQIKAPDEQILKDYLFEVRGGPQEPGLWLSKEIEAVVASLEGCLVFLRGRPDDRGVYDRMREYQNSAGEVDLGLMEAGWSGGLDLRFDLQPIQPTGGGS